MNTHVVTLAAGDVTAEARLFLEQHGARIEESLGILIITLPDTANVDRDTYVKSQYYIWWYDAEGNEEEQFLEVELYIDAYETRIRLRK